MADIKFSREEKEALTGKIQLYFSEQLEQQIGRFDAEFFLDFISREIGPCYYNRGLHDAQATLSNKLDELVDAIYQLEQPTEFGK